jgi:hypothetical protein
MNRKMANANNKKREKKMKIEKLDIQPGLAKSWLEKHNIRNRSMNARKYERMAQSIKNKEWLFNAQPIVFDINGVLLDGQHRLMACVMADIAIKSLVVWGAQPESQSTMDLGTPRSVADILALEGYSNHFARAALAKRIANYKNLGLRHAVGQSTSPTHGEILREGRELPNPNRYLSQAIPVGRLLKFNPSLVGLLMWLTDQIDEQDSEHFWGRLKSGADLREGDAIFALRSWALDPGRNVSPNSYAAKLTQGAIIVKAWNKFRAGELVNRLSFRLGGSNPEQFPEMI